MDSFKDTFTDNDDWTNHISAVLRDILTELDTKGVDFDRFKTMKGQVQYWHKKIQPDMIPELRDIINELYLAGLMDTDSQHL